MVLRLRASGRASIAPQTCCYFRRQQYLFPIEMRPIRVYHSKWPRPRQLFSGNRHYGLQLQIRQPLSTAPRLVSRNREPLLYPVAGARYASTAKPSTQPTTASSNQTQQSIEDLLSSLPLTRYLRSSTSPKYIEFRPYRTMHPSAQSTHLVTTSLLSNPTKLPTDPIFFLTSPSTKTKTQTQPQIIATAYLSTHLTGHAGYIHGGLPFLLFDDVFARLAAEIFPSRVGMTATMGLDFRAPAVPGRVYVWRAFVEKRESERKVWVRGEMRCLREFGVGEMSARNVVDIDVDVAGGDGDGVSVEEREGVLVAEARALFVEPRRVEGMVPLYPN
ncbi:PaaI family thioesterase [Aspergillus puulaauensis]|uniref:Thioesterase domain-containing protein n=1 Tax=Aspergillus puulaauensis TaxID=1220207 RepID=A0A7R8AGY8_9EURO|nr:uncharacterized protein APUU_11962A [Aspergillus puulaauensis]BCS19134.1 hypothetical protein APUU_11962A [Aspergillus puulaauensis]